MSKRQAEKRPMAHENCVKEERLKMRPMAKESVLKRNAYEKDKMFERIPIFRGFILKEVK